MYDFVCVCVLKYFFLISNRQNSLFLPLIIERQTFLMKIFKYAIPLHKYTVILPKLGKICTCLSGSNWKERERGKKWKDGEYLENIGNKMKKLKNIGRFYTYVEKIYKRVARPVRDKAITIA